MYAAHVTVCNVIMVCAIFSLLFTCRSKFSIANRYRDIAHHFNNIPIAFFVRRIAR